MFQGRSPSPSPHRRPSPLRARAWLGSLLALTIACGRDDAPWDDDGNGGAAGSPGDGGEVEELVFEPSDPLLLAPGARGELWVRASPGGRHNVSFGLLSENPALIEDAFLNVTQTMTSESGAARVLVTAPSQPATFTVRASSGSVEARRAVSVSSRGFAKLRVVPEYAGKRDLRTWTASARVGVTCAELADPLSDGPLLAQGSAPLDLSGVPVGPEIAVTVRSGQLAAGCLTVTRLTTDEARTVLVRVTDLPLRLDTGSFALTFGIESSTTELGLHLSGAIDQALAAFTRGKADDAAVLLDALAELLDEDDAAAFQQRRVSQAFDALTLGSWSEPTLLRKRTRELLAAAALAVPSRDTFQGDLTFHAMNARFRLITAAGAPADQSGFLVTSNWTRSLAAGNGVVLSGSLRYQASRWLTSIAEAQSAAANTPAPPLDLAARADCSELAELWTEGDGELFPGCGSNCARALCVDALVNAWELAGAGDSSLTTLGVAMTAQARENPDATIASFDGTWLGTLSSGGATLSGAAHGESQGN